MSADVVRTGLAIEFAKYGYEDKTQGDSTASYRFEKEPGYTLLVDHHSSKTHFEFYVGWPKSNGHMYHSPPHPERMKVRISKKKNPVKIAEEVYARVLVDYEPLWDEQQVKKQQYDLMLEQQDQLVKELAELYNTTAIKDQPHELIPRKHKVDRIIVGTGDVQIHLDGLTPDEAKAISRTMIKSFP